MTILSVDELRGYVNTDLDDVALQRLLNAAEEAIGDASGVETHEGGQSYIFLRRRAASITTVTETDIDGVETELDDSDYRLRVDGVSLLRLPTGENPPVWTGRTISLTPWAQLVAVEYKLAVKSELARVQAALVELDINHTPGLTSETIGAWSESANSGVPYEKERAAIIESLGTIPPGFA